jgi:hypothetical protein
MLIPVNASNVTPNSNSMVSLLKMFRPPADQGFSQGYPPTQSFHPSSTNVPVDDRSKKEMLKKWNPYPCNHFKKPQGCKYGSLCNNFHLDASGKIVEETLGSRRRDEARRR